MGIISEFLDRVIAGPGFAPEHVVLREVTPDVLAWLNDDDDNSISDYPGPSWQHDAFEPSPLDEAEWSGMSLRLAGEPTAELMTDSTTLLLRFAVGQQRGLELRQAEERADREWELSRSACIEAMYQGREHHGAEVVEALGVAESRLRKENLP